MFVDEKMITLLENNIRETENVLNSMKQTLAEMKKTYQMQENPSQEEPLQEDPDYAKHEILSHTKERMEKMIAENYNGYRLPLNAGTDLFKEFGKETVEYLAANTIINKSYDGRFSNINKEWAADILNHTPFRGQDIVLTTHPAVLNGLTDLIRAAEKLSPENTPEKKNVKRKRSIMSKI